MLLMVHTCCEALTVQLEASGLLAGAFSEDHTILACCTRVPRVRLITTLGLRRLPRELPASLAPMPFFPASKVSNL